MAKSKRFVDLRMRLFLYNATIKQLQLLVWVTVYFIIFFSSLPMQTVTEAAVFTLMTTIFYATIIYGNISFLFPQFYEKGHYVKYAVYVIGLLSIAGIVRGLLTAFIYYHYFNFNNRPAGIDFKNSLNFIIPATLIYVLSFIFRIAMEYFKLKQQAEEMLLQKSRAELNLLKSQVQPHFLFNTLNNIYYEAYREAPATAQLIERLSDIMRYFVDESPRDRILLTTEIQFLKNYIALEKIRIRHGVNLTFRENYGANLSIPPMLLMTFIENIFKHGIDKSSNVNSVEVCLTQQNDYLFFETKNSITYMPTGISTSGFGIKNLRERLTLLYGTNFELKTISNADTFTAFLKVPLI